MSQVEACDPTTIASRFTSLDKAWDQWNEVPSKQALDQYLQMLSDNTEALQACNMDATQAGMQAAEMQALANATDSYVRQHMPPNLDGEVSVMNQKAALLSQAYDANRKRTMLLGIAAGLMVATALIMLLMLLMGVSASTRLVVGTVLLLFGVAGTIGMLISRAGVTTASAAAPPNPLGRASNGVRTKSFA